MKRLVIGLSILGMVFAAGITVPTKNTGDSLTAAEFSQFVDALRYGAKDINTAIITANKLTDGTIILTGGNLTGATGVTATNLTGTLQTAAQPSITSLGTITNLVATNVSSAGTITADKLVAGLFSASTAGGIEYNSAIADGTRPPSINLYTESQEASGQYWRLVDADSWNYGAYLKQNYLTGHGQLTLGTRGGGTDTDALFLRAGNVGIGTTAPGYKLNVNGMVGVENGYGLQWDDAAAGSSAIGTFKIDATDRLVLDTSSYAYPLIVDVSAISLNKTSNGKVWIGTGGLDVAGTVSGSSLQVNGQIARKGGFDFSWSGVITANVTKDVIVMVGAAPVNVCIYSGIVSIVVDDNSANEIVKTYSIARSYANSVITETVTARQGAETLTLLESSVGTATSTLSLLTNQTGTYFITIRIACRELTYTTY